MANNNNPKNVSVGKPMADGAVFTAPAGTELPKNCSTELNVAFKCVGLISEDGVSNEIETDSEEIKAWGGDVVLNPQTSRVEKFSFTMIETNEQSLKVVFGDKNVTGTDIETGFQVKHNGADREERVFVIETIMGTGNIKRQVIPRGKVSEIGEIVYKDDEAIGYEVTITALLDAEGNTAYEYIGKPAGAAAALKN